MLTVQASALYRIVPCKGQISLTPTGVSADDDDVARREGIALHHLANEVLNSRIKHPLDMVDHQINGIFITGAMAEAVATYTDALFARGFTGQTEMNLDWLCVTPSGNVNVLSRCDHASYDASTDTLYIDDVKFGYRIVEVVGNWTLLAYAIGYCIRHNLTPRRVVMTIHQPRPLHEDGFTREWVTEYNGAFMNGIEALRYHLAQLYEINPLVTGEHCNHCPLMITCPAATRAGYNSVDVSMRAFNQDVTNDEFVTLMDVLERAYDHLGSLIEAYKELGLHRVSQGQVIQRNGMAYMTERGQGNRKFIEGMTPDLIKALTGIDVSVSKTVTPAEAGRRGISDTVLGVITERPPTAVKLVKRDVNKMASKRLAGK